MLNIYGFKVINDVSVKINRNVSLISRKFPFLPVRLFTILTQFVDETFSAFSSILSFANFLIPLLFVSDAFNSRVPLPFSQRTDNCNSFNCGKNGLLTRCSQNEGKCFVSLRLQLS